MYVFENAGSDMLVEHHTAHNTHSAGHHSLSTEMLLQLGSDLEIITFDSSLLDGPASFASPPTSRHSSHACHSARRSSEHPRHLAPSPTKTMRIASPQHSSPAANFASSGPDATAEGFSELYYDYLFSGQQLSMDNEADSRAQHVASPTFEPSTPPSAWPRSANHNNMHNKPAFSYRALVGTILQEAGPRGLTLKEMYACIEEKYPYFHTASAQGQGASWRSSVRHNLVSHAEFARVEMDPDETSASAQRKRAKKNAAAAAAAAADLTASPQMSIDSEGGRADRVNHGRRTRWALTSPGTFTITSEESSSARPSPAAKTTTEGGKPPRSHKKKQPAQSLTETVNTNNNTLYYTHSSDSDNNAEHASVKQELTKSPMAKSASSPLLKTMRTPARQPGSSPSKTPRRSTSPLTTSPYAAPGQSGSPLCRSASTSILNSHRSLPCDVPGRLPSLPEDLVAGDNALHHPYGMLRGSSVPTQLHSFSADSWLYASPAPSRPGSFCSSVGPQFNNNNCISSPPAQLNEAYQLGYGQPAAHALSPRPRLDSLSSVDEHFERSLGMADQALYARLLHESAPAMSRSATAEEILDLAVWLSGC